MKDWRQDGTDLVVSIPRVVVAGRPHVGRQVGGRVSPREGVGSTPLVEVGPKMRTPAKPLGVRRNGDPVAA